ncbi:MAG: hypothetical protein PHO26_02895 [Dehalococcoidia bacterium]|nr:hypothetical protein [Dehalococcoidia bacterium]MDD5493987.1 hypothetical protein [Dehalococcoidia bacterium]
MSKFIDKLHNLNKDAVPPMGFKKVEAEPKHLSMLVIAELSGKTETEIKEIAESGVAAGILKASGLSASALAKSLKSCGNLPLGLMLDSDKIASAGKLISGEIDFVVFDTRVPVTAMEEKILGKAGKVLRVNPDMEISLLRAVNNVYPLIDAVLIDLRNAHLTLDNLLNCQRTADIVGQPLVAYVSKSTDVIELAGLRDSGVKSILVGEDASASEIKTVIETIGALPRPVKRKEKGSAVLLPRISAAPDKEDEGGEDDDD